jgi:chromosome segregation ATPase
MHMQKESLRKGKGPRWLGGNEMWICPYCGEENYQNDRIGLEEPKCRACKHERRTAKEVEKEIDKEITNLKIEMKDLRLRMEPHEEMIASLVDELAEERSSLRELKDEWKENKREVDRLEARIVYTRHDKILSAMKNKYQKLLSDFIRGGLYQRKRKEVNYGRSS